jgi:hypothetical protein
MIDMKNQRMMKYLIVVYYQWNIHIKDGFVHLTKKNFYPTTITTNSLAKSTPEIPAYT